MEACVHDYHEGNHYFQDRFDTRRIADQIASRTRDHIDDPARAFIEQADMFFLATCDHRVLPTCSYKGGDPGFVRILGERWLAFPNYDGKGKYQSMGNLQTCREFLTAKLPWSREALQESAEPLP